MKAMELEEMKSLWDEISDKIEKQNQLTDKLIIMMTQEQYRNRLRKITVPELGGGIFCYAVFVLILVNLGQLDTWYLMTSGIVTMLILLILPVLSLKYLYQMNNIRISKSNFKETLEKYTKGKIRFKKLQKAGYYLGFILMLISLPVANKIINGEDIFTQDPAWLWFVPLGTAFFFVFTWLVYRYYSRTINQMEEILRELEN